MLGVPLEFCVGLTGVAAALGIGADLRSEMRSSARIPKHRNLTGVTMESSREGVVKKLNGHGSGITDNGKPAEAPQTTHSELVDELAQAMKMARESLERAQPPSLTPTAPPLPSMPAPRGLFDDEEDDAAMPIPSTWRTPPEPPRSGTLRDQVRAGALGFATGLAVVIPAVLLLTGRLGDLPIDSLFGQNEPLSETAGQSAAGPAQSQLQVPQRTVSTTLVTKPQTPLSASAAVPLASTTPAPSRETPSFAPVTTTPPSVSPVVAKAEPPAEPKVSWTSAIAEGKGRILAGDIVGGRKMLEPAVAANEPEAIMALAETYDPNMLAAWGVREVTADVQRARELYQKALRAGVEPARARLAGLN